MERRRSTRIPFKAPAFVLQGGNPIASEIRNISAHGIFIKSNCQQLEGDKIRVTMHLHSGKTTLTVTLPCTVTRVSDSGIGCTSPQLEPETLLFMSNLIHSQKVPPPEFMHSFYNHLDGLEPHARS